MRLLVVRHGDAADALEFAASGKSDDLRPLTDEGRARMQRAARGIHRLLPELDGIIASPLVRARQTAELIAAPYGIARIDTSAALRPEARVEEVADLLREHPAGATLAVVGHEPHVSTLITWLVAGMADSRVRMGKGSACLLDTSPRAPREPTSIRWLLTQKQLELLGTDD